MKLWKLLFLICAITPSIAYPAEPSDPGRAVSYIQKLQSRARAGDVRAQVCLGKIYWHGSAVTYDQDKAAELFREAASKGDPEGQLYDVELKLKSSQDAVVLRDSIAIVKKLSDDSFVPAEEYLSRLYLYGADPFVAQNSEKALDLMKKAAAQDDAYAETGLANLYGHGWGVKTDRGLAKRWSSKAANHVFDCLADFSVVANDLIMADVIYPDKIMELSAPVATQLGVLMSNGRARDVVIVKSSGDEALDAAAVKAADDVSFPIWKTMSGIDARYMMQVNFTPGASMDSVEINKFVTDLRNTVRASVVLPKHDLLYGTTGTGIVQIKFAITDGRISNVEVAQSSDDKEVDDAVIEAVKNVTLPAMDSSLKSIKTYVLNLDFRNDLSLVDDKGNARLVVPKAATVAAPATATQ